MNLQAINLWTERDETGDEQTAVISGAFCKSEQLINSIDVAQPFKLKALTFFSCLIMHAYFSYR